MPFMADSLQLLKRLTPDHFASVMGSAPKKVREELFRRAGIKNKGGAFALRTSQKTEARIKKLYEVIGSASDIPDELVEEVIRQYLFNRRDLLAQALDFFGVEHDHGLTDADLDFLSELETEKKTELRRLLKEKHDDADVELYLGFMGIGDA